MGMVAKVYDPLYIDDDDGFMNPFLLVDRFYTHEVGTYEKLSQDQGKSIPRFYGSYSLDLPVGDDGSRMRTVRLILIEYIPGVSMQQARPEEFSQSTRKEIMKSVIDFETSAYQRNIILRDLSPRNVMMADRSKDQPDEPIWKDLVFIDFATADFNRKPDRPLPAGMKRFLSQYIPPPLRWGMGRADEFSCWIDWEWPTWVEAEYAHTASMITPEMRRTFHFTSCNPSKYALDCSSSDMRRERSDQEQPYGQKFGHRPNPAT